MKKGISSAEDVELVLSALKKRQPQGFQLTFRSMTAITGAAPLLLEMARQGMIAMPEQTIGFLGSIVRGHEKHTWFNHLVCIAPTLSFDASFFADKLWSYLETITLFKLGTGVHFLFAAPQGPYPIAEMKVLLRRAGLHMNVEAYRVQRRVGTGKMKTASLIVLMADDVSACSLIPERFTRLRAKTILCAPGIGIVEYAVVRIDEGLHDAIPQTKEPLKLLAIVLQALLELA